MANYSSLQAQQKTKPLCQLFTRSSVRCPSAPRIRKCVSRRCPTNCEKTLAPLKPHVLTTSTQGPLIQPRTMPPKILYGKKKSATRTTTSFSKFISPRKDEVASQGNVEENMSDVAEPSWRQQLQDAAKGAPEDKEVAALEKGLVGLKLEQTNTQTAEEVEPKRRGRPRKADHDRNNVEMKKVETKGNEIKNVALAEKETSTTQTKDETDEHSKMDQKKFSRTSIQTAPSQLENATQSKKSKRCIVPENWNAVDVQADMKFCSSNKGSAKKAGRQARDSTSSSPIRKHDIRSGGKSKRTSRSRKPPLPTPEPTPEPDDIYFKYASPLISLSFGKKIVPFEQWSAELEPHFEISKIAEASFSEVYRLSASDSTSMANQESVLKVVALKTPPTAPLPCQLQTRVARDRAGQEAKEIAEREENDQWKSEVDDVLSEVKLLQNLNDIPGFTNFRDLTILQGRPSPAFNDAWKAWNKSRPRGKKSEFPDPSKKASYDDTQLWAIVEMQDAGTDCEKIMENGGLSSIWEVWDVFWGVCLSVAKAEETCKFEHRDLHMGNICVRSSRAGGDVLNITVKDPTRRKFRYTGLETTVIDYTLSRADIVSAPSRRSSAASICSANSSSLIFDAKDVDVAWLDLNKDPAIFEGDASEEYQYEVYRYMRGAALYNNPLQNAPLEAPEAVRRSSPRKNTHIRFNESDSPHRSPHKPTAPDPISAPPVDVWKSFCPKTNLIWAHFLLHKLLAHLEDNANTPDKHSITQITANVESRDEPAKIRKRALKLHSILKKVSELLCPVALGREESLDGVKDLIVLALEERWLRVDDVAA
ncbi:hypothetical protein BDU57DRAFT_512442 [Ampelomyces quisqualis]|uniref:non-specific serine/threonine protein kinase n=1 Tax=Ampelomyces quisqualis TaxID=50730 RepID=A0A6A5QV76_AMPQU|nr:hypothetical protein BDU57DRAFT_512442 [Ampelomyces quisqualis]